MWQVTKILARVMMLMVIFQRKCILPISLKVCHSIIFISQMIEKSGFGFVTSFSFEKMNVKS